MFKWLRKVFCLHDFLGVSEDRYNVIRHDGSKEGEVTLLYLKCKKCGHEELIPVNRTHLA